MIVFYCFRRILDHDGTEEDVTVDGVGGVKLSNDNGLDKWLNNQGVECLVDSEGDQVILASSCCLWMAAFTLHAGSTVTTVAAAR